jgi:protein OS-9
MIIYTARLCNDVAFMPPPENKPHAISCREVVSASEYFDWETRKTIEATKKLKESPLEVPTIIGGIEIAAKKQVGSEGRVIEGGHAVGVISVIEILARGAAASNGGKIEMLSDEKLKNLNLSPEDVKKLSEKVEKMADGKSWKLKMVDVSGMGNQREFIGVVDPDEDMEDDRIQSSEEDEMDAEEEWILSRSEEDSEDGSEDGSEERYKEEL